METILSHPSHFIAADDVTAIRNAAAQAEQAGVLHEDQLKVIYRHDLFRLLVPQVYGGLQTTLSDLVRLQEAISWADGSTGWVVTLCCGAGWFGGFLPVVTAKEVFDTPNVCLAGSGAPGGTAAIIGDNYLINGSWRYASGAHHATHITANCIITKNGKTVMDDGGQPLVLPFIFDKKDVEILPAWKYTGMVATGSDSFAVKELTVSKDRQFKIDPAAAIIDEPLYRYPFLHLAEATLAVNISGIAIHFMDLCEKVFEERARQPRLTEAQKELIFRELSTCKTNLDQQRTLFFNAVDASWQAGLQNAVIGNDLLKEVSATSRNLARLARESVDKLYPYCGLIAASTQNSINRAWRDLHTASQHSLLTFL